VPAQIGGSREADQAVVGQAVDAKVKDAIRQVVAALQADDPHL